MKYINRPSIVSMVGEYLFLHKSGKEYVGLCPFHSEKRPSLYVNEEKGFFHCFGCGAGGDAITFVMKFENLSFADACRFLKIENERKPTRALTARRKRSAELAAAWANEQRAKFNQLIADGLEQRDLADEIGDFELAEIFNRELVMFREFYDALTHPRTAMEMLALRESIEAITQGIA